MSFYGRIGKRALDVSIAAPLVLLLLPAYALIAAAILATLGRPVLFRQRRPGLHGEPFELLKFRTMIEPERAGGGADDERRLVPLGRFLRRWSLDELPELWNVLRGEMSLVGPRPLLMEYLGRYTPEQMRRHDVDPGITGWAQVNGRNALTWKQKFEHDVWYVEHRSLALDLKILALTVGQLLRGGEISSPGHATMPEFRGDEED